MLNSMSHDPFLDEVSRDIWRSKYQYRHGGVARDRDITDTWRRVAHALAGVEPRDQAAWEQRFFETLENFRFLPGGRILAGAGTQQRVTLFNCFVMGRIEDSMDGIFDALKEGALTLQQGGGVGYDFSTLRPAGTRARAVGTVASGPVSFMRIWDAMCATLLSTGARRGAMMATLRCDHPDIETFITTKATAGELRHFNLSVLVSDAFMRAVQEDREWPLVFPRDGLEPSGGDTLRCAWPGCAEPVTCQVVRRVRARQLWDRIMHATYDYAEPGVLFIDRINHWNNLGYRERISATNPCGEIPLPPYGACDLGSINLTRLVRHPFSAAAELDWQALRDTARTATRMLDDVIDLSRYPLEAQAEQARGSRRIGLGLTGLGDSLIMLGLHYGSAAARSLAGEVMAEICHSAYRSSVELARDKGPFPFLVTDRHLERPFIQALPEDICEGIHRHGIRNSHCTAIAPTGTISLLANNVSSGLEPVFAFRHTRQVLSADGSHHRYTVVDQARHLWERRHGPAEPLPEAFVEARELAPEQHLAMQAAVQPNVDNAISKTVNVPADYPFEAFRALYQRAYELGLKGCTTFRPNPVTGAVLETLAPGEPDSHCCSLERETD